MAYDTPADRATPLARFSLRAMRPDRKLAAALVFSVGVSALQRPAPALAACCLAVLLLVCSGIPRALAARRLLSVNAFFLLLWLLLPLSFMPRGTEHPFFVFGFLAVYPSGLDLALLITLKGNAMAVAFLALAGSSTVVENGHALGRLRAPDKLVALLLITHANLALMGREYTRLFRAARLRGFRPRTSLASYATHARLVALLLVRSWQHAQRVESAMRLRGFSGRFPLIPSRCTCPAHVQARNRNAAAALFFFCCLATALLVAWDRLF